MKRIFSVVLLAGIILTAGYWLGKHNNATPQLEPIIAAKQVYVCPMHSNIVQDHPGNCPICGMELVLSGQSAAETQIHVDTATQQKFGVRLAVAERRMLTKDIHTYATLVPDAGLMQRITPSVDGILMKLYAARPGQSIAIDEPLYEIFSQDLLQLQNDYIDFDFRYSLAVKSSEETRKQNKIMLESMYGQGNGGNELMEKGLRQSEEQIRSVLQPMFRDGQRLIARLKVAGFTDTMLKQLIKKDRGWDMVTVRAQHACIVSEVNARVGMTLSAMSDILSCADASHAWLEVVFYPGQIEYIHEGDMLDVEFQNGNSIATRLSGLSSIADAATHTVKARIPIKLTAEHQLGDYAEVLVHSAPREVLTVPDSAVIRSGHGNFVMRGLANGHFKLQKVITGISNDEYIAIIEGLDAGDKVAVNGQFLLDAAASIADAAQRQAHHN
jgi:Cu(I)/Ag(I) efflux system membrane fusion protein